ncbi:MAG: nuclear transport factor 2 family protein [Chloroflexota bacterium]|nr:nuclear transport factor 2 family protein [Chloroflexota bacterium]
MTMDDEIRIVRTFHDALNAKDVAGVLALATEDIRVGGPRGTGEGKHLLEEWVNHASITMEPQRWFHMDGTVVVEQIARWHDPGTGEETSSQRLATTFGIRDGRIASIARYGDIGEAVTSAGMDESNAVTIDDQPGEDET